MSGNVKYTEVRDLSVFEGPCGCFTVDASQREGERPQARQLRLGHEFAEATLRAMGEVVPDPRFADVDEKFNLVAKAETPLTEFVGNRMYLNPPQG